jgi:hypothetical protein
LRKRVLAKPITVLHMSDLHASGVVPLEFIANAVRRGVDLEPDLVLLTGDFVTGRFSQFDEYARVLRPLSEHHPAFASLGNHDGGRWAAARGGYEDTAAVRDLLDRSGVRLLHNRSIDLEVREASLRLVGLGDLWAGEFLPVSAFAPGPKDGGAVTLVLSHNPDTKEALRAHNWDVMFCGHTHGGQLHLPLLGAPFAPVRDKRFVKGLHAWEGRWIYITKGVGNLLGVRFNCRPEISLITLQ